MHAAYFETRFFSALPLRQLPAEGVIITAYATTGSIWPDEVNRHADASLAAHLQALGLGLEDRLIGYAPATGHAEPGWLVPLDPCRGREIGRRFHQDAIYLVQAGWLSVTRCDGSTAAEPVARLAERLDWISAEEFAARLSAC